MGYSIYANIWIFLHVATVLSFFSSIILSFKNPFHLKDTYIVGTILHLYIAFLDLRVPSSIRNQPFSNRLLLDYSVHIVGCNVLFFFLSGPSFSWTMVLGLTSFYQVLNFLVGQILPNHRGNWLLEKCQVLHQKLTNPPLAKVLLATLEIMSLMPSIAPGLSKGNIFFIFIAYLFWHVLYRYAVDNDHKQIWAQFRQKIATLAYKLPTFLCNIIMNILNSFERLGAVGCQIYTVKSN